MAIRENDLVRKGNGSTVYRVWSIREAYGVSVVKATTKVRPTRGCYYPAESFTVVGHTDAPWETREGRKATPAPVQTAADIKANAITSASRYVDDYTELLASVVERTGSAPADLVATLESYRAKLAAAQAL
jgi:hypothetical protein